MSYLELKAGIYPTIPNHGWWIMGPSNWNSVCWSGVITVALSVLGDNQDRLRFVDLAMKYGNKYLNSYTADGFVTEGITF